jgi:apolipoprotein N-acyltransferase
MLKNPSNFLMCVISGLLLGLSVPSFSWLPLGFFAWLWIVPLLFELKRARNFGTFLKQSLTAVGIGFTLITLWVVNASVLGFLASTLVGVFVWTIPFVFFYFVRRRLGWNAALWTLPFVWTAWEWIYHRTDFSFGAVRLGYTQADLIWLIQYADITGVEGVTCWLVLLNVALFVWLEKQTSAGNFRFSRQMFSRPSFAAIVLLFVLPLAYAASVWSASPAPIGEISVVAVQPNVSPFVEFKPKSMTRIYNRTVALTDKALKENAPDLIVWHEIAFPYLLSDDASANAALAGQIAEWNAPLLTGLFEVKEYANGEPRPPLLEAQNRSREYFNAAGIFQPADISGGILPIASNKLYRKRRLMPFIERVPLAERFPSLAEWMIPVGVRPQLSRGETARTLDFQAKNAELVRVGALICYENLYPEMSADSVRNGAQFLAAITNEGFFAGSQGQYQLAAFSRFRSIETRREMVRAAATGMTWTTDRFGLVKTQIPMRSERFMSVRVALSDEQTIYVRFGDFFAKACVFLSLLLLAFCCLPRRAAKTQAAQ